MDINCPLMNNGRKLFWSGVLFSADVPFAANWRVRPQSDLFANQSTLLQADLFAASSDAKAYHAEAYVPRVIVSQLRIASTEYPEGSAKGIQLPRRCLSESVNLLLTPIIGQCLRQSKATAATWQYPYDSKSLPHLRDRTLQITSCLI
jgi:hypothetical protein